jgi:hypothetical protein
MSIQGIEAVDARSNQRKTKRTEKLGQKYEKYKFD